MMTKDHQPLGNLLVAAGVNEQINGTLSTNSSTASPDSMTDDSQSTPEYSEKSASIQKYEDEWNLLYCREDPDWGELKRRAILGNLRASRFRSVCWRCLLSVFPPEHSEWLSQLRETRAHYAQLAKALCVEPWHPMHSSDHPLSENTESVWNQYFCDEGLQGVIRQDVVRTFPGVEFFHKESIQRSMVNILFCYARENPAMCYRQGMHEILAPLLFVLHCDHQAMLHTREQVEVNRVISEVLDPAYLEEDGFTLFSAIMKGIEPCYQINDMTPDATGYFPSVARSPTDSPGQRENQVVSQLRWIKDHLLAPHDLQLHNHLEELDIPLPIFGIRWLRLLFGREFPLQDLLVLWDAIFAEGRKFEFVNYVVVAMLIAIRQQLLDGDYTTCLTYLMRYPAAVDINYIIEHALYLKDPSVHCLPAMTSFPSLMAASRGGGGGSARHHHPSRPSHPSHPQHQANQGAGVRGKGGEGGGGGGTLTRLKKSVQSARWTGAATAGKVKPVQMTRDNDSNIVDGFTLDDPLVIHAELQHAHQVMALCRLKLIQYHNVLKRSISPSHAVEAQQALDGVTELCGLLGSRYRSQPPPPPVVEPALEAGEGEGGEPPPHGRLPLEVVTAPKGNVELKMFGSYQGKEGQPIQGAPLTDPIVWRSS